MKLRLIIIPILFFTTQIWAQRDSSNNKFLSEDYAFIAKVKKNKSELIEINDKKDELSRPKFLKAPVVDPEKRTINEKLELIGVPANNTPILPKHKFTDSAQNQISGGKNSLTSPDLNSETTTSLIKRQATFQGERFSYLVDKGSFAEFYGYLNDESYFNYFLELVNSGVDDLITSLLKEKQRLNLNGYGYFLLTWECTSKLVQNHNSRVLLEWAILSRSLFDVKVATYNSEILLISAIDSKKCSNTTYYSQNGVDYFVLTLARDKTSQLGAAYLFKDNFSYAFNALDFEMVRPPKIENNMVSKQRFFNVDNGKKKLSLKFSRSLMNYYNSIPKIDSWYYFHSKFSPAVEKEIVSFFKPILAGKTELQKAQYLLTFSQFATEYKTDLDQFGVSDKPFYADESLFYDYSDCEDRAVLFANLIQLFTNCKVKGVRFPGHMCTAVKFSEEIDGTYFSQPDGKYFVCDPTYFNAVIGECMPEFKESNGTLYHIN